MLVYANMVFNCDCSASASVLRCRVASSAERAAETCASALSSCVRATSKSCCGTRPGSLLETSVSRVKDK